MCLKAIKEQSRYCGTYLEVSIDVLKSKGTSFVLCYEEHHLYLSYEVGLFFENVQNFIQILKMH